MLNYIWGGMLILGIIWSALHGNMSAVTEEAINGSKEAVTLCITMLGVISMWSGVMEIAETSGLVASFTKKIKPFIHFMFPDIPKGHKAEKDISTNIIANVLGLGWAATPAGLNAMRSLQEINPTPDTASRDMCSFLILNISSLQLIPMTIITYRSQYGSANPSSIVLPCIIATTISTLVGIIFAKVMGRRK